MTSLLEGLRLDKNTHFLLSVRDPLPRAELGEFAEEYVDSLNNQDEKTRIAMVCGLITSVYELGIFNGKEDAIASLSRLIKKGKV